MSLRSLFVVLMIAVGLTVLFWWPLWQGYGLIGGDLYTYFFPQKLFYAGQLVEGRLPLWNDLVGFGYPFLAESQAGVFYPPNPLLYRLFDVNTAYNVSQLGHYVLAFVFTWLLLRRLDLTPSAAALGGIVFVYGWFPPRICLEWAIIGGVYFPLALWCVESFLHSGRRRWLVILAVSQGIHLLAGHFNLAFITQLTCVAYAGLRVSAIGVRRESTAKPDAKRPHPGAGMATVLVIAAIAFGFAFAAVQLLPTWELKQLSQRDGPGTAHDPGYGHIPPWYLSQIVAPWLWYPDDMDPDQALQTIHVLTTSSATNKVEAHLYFGMIPLLLVLYRLVTAMRGDTLDRRHRCLLWLGLAAMIYATGWLLPITRHLPGFSFFMGPGRYGIVTTLAAAVIAGAGLDRLLEHRHLEFHSIVIGLAVGLTIADLFWVSRRVFYAEMTEDPPINHVEESEVRRLLTEYETIRGPAREVRMLARGPNWATLTGFAAYPGYLGIGPAAYYDPELTMPEPTQDMSPDERAAASAAQHAWLRRGAFTHILSMQPLDAAEWPDAELIWRGVDGLLSPTYALREPLSLYELTDSLPRIRCDAAASVTVKRTDRSTVAVTVSTPDGGELVWADLAYPGWRADIDGDAGTRSVETDNGLFRTVSLPPGNADIVWRYDPRSFQVGAAVSLCSWAALGIVCGHWLLRRRRTASRDAAKEPPSSTST